MEAIGQLKDDFNNRVKAMIDLGQADRDRKKHDGLEKAGRSVKRMQVSITLSGFPKP